eukprot:751776-Hanusia_phi.AAC.2
MEPNKRAKFRQDRGLHGLHVAVPLAREASFNLDFDKKGLATFKYSAKDYATGQPRDYVVSEKGEKGFQMSDLELGQELGHGEAGCVLKARHKPTNRLFALKRVNICEQSTRHQVMRELQAYRECGSMPQIVDLFDVFYVEQRVYMVLELMTWGSLELLIHSHNVKIKREGSGKYEKMQESLLSSIAFSVLKALRFLHDDHKMVHRDLKPGNVLLSMDGGVKLSDFGVSIRDADTDCVAGTVGYMSPERLDGQVCSDKGDIWALGIMILECAKGVHPFVAGDFAPRTQADLWAIVVQKDPPSAKGLDYSPDFEGFIDACLIKHEPLRPSASALLQYDIIRSHAGCAEKTVREFLKAFGKPEAEMGSVPQPDPASSFLRRRSSVGALSSLTELDHDSPRLPKKFPSPPSLMSPLHSPGRPPLPPKPPRDSTAADPSSLAGKEGAATSFVASFLDPPADRGRNFKTTSKTSIQDRPAAAGLARKFTEDGLFRKSALENGSSNHARTFMEAPVTAAGRNNAEDGILPKHFVEKEVVDVGAVSDSQDGAGVNLQWFGMKDVYEEDCAED